jgi:hypothetical protein
MPGILVEQVEGLVDPLKSYQFRMNVSPVRGTANFIGNDVMSLRCTGTAFTGSTLPQIAVDLGGFHVQYNGMRMFSHTWVTTLIEDQELNISLQIASWMKLIYNQRTGVGNFKRDYASQATVEIFNDPDQVVGVRTLYGIWPTVDPDLLMAFAGGGTRIDKPVTWSFDYWDDDALSSDGTGTQAGTQAAL